MAAAGGPPVVLDVKQYLSAESERARISSLEHTAIRWSTRAKEANLTIRQRDYAVARVRSTTTELAPRVSSCGTSAWPIACGRELRTPGRGVKHLLERRCRQWFVCERCARSRRARMRQRVADGLERALRDATTRGHRPVLRMSTMTVRHTGDVAADVEHLYASWRALYKRLVEWLGRFAYVAPLEVTPGADGRGHPHLHLVWVGPRFVSYGRLLAMWRRATRDDGANFDHQTRGNSVESAAKYASKYASKGSQAHDFSGDLLGRVLGAIYNRHTVLTSRGFWCWRGCACCGRPFYLTGAIALMVGSARHRADEVRPSFVDPRAGPGTA